MVPLTMLVLNASMFRVALPTIRTAFDIQADVAAWLVTAFILPYLILMPLYGRLSDGLGKRRLFLLGITVFLVGTAVALLAADLRLLILARVIQGVGLSGVEPLSYAIILELFPANERGRTLGTWNSIGPAASLSGLFLAGLLIDNLGWRTIFGVVLLAGLAALLAVHVLIPSAQRGFVQPGFLRTFDWGGVMLLSAATTTLVVYASSRPITGVEALQDWRLLTITLALFGSFIFWEKRCPTPFVSLNMFAIKNFTQTSFCAGIRMFAMHSIGFLIPLYLADVRALSAASIGIILMFPAVPMLMAIRLGGQLADHWGSRWPIVVGLLVQAGMVAYLALLPYTAPLVLVVAGLVGHSLGAGLSLAPMHRSTMSKITREQTGEASGIYSMIRFVGAVLGIALAGVVLQQGLERSLLPIEAYQTVFWMMAGVVLLGAVVGWRLRE